MRIRRHQLHIQLRAGLRPPHMRPRQKQALQPRKLVLRQLRRTTLGNKRADRGIRQGQTPIGQIHAVGHNGDTQAAQVTNVFAQGELAIHPGGFNAGLPDRCGNKALELVHQLRGAFRERRPILIRPPGMQITVTIILGTLVVKPVADLVADHRTNRPEILRRIGVGGVERWAQNSGGERNIVDRRIIERIHSLRGAKPLRTIIRLRNFVQLVVVQECGTPAHVFHQGSPIRFELQAGVIPPLIRVADLGLELGQLLQGSLPGCRGHPRQLADPLVVGLDQVIH